MKRKNLLTVLGIVTTMILTSGCGIQSVEKAEKSEIVESEGLGRATVEIVSNVEESNEVINLWFYYPTQVGGDLANGMEEMVADFNSSHENINVTAVYSGSYKQTAQKAMSDLAAGNGPSVVLSGMLDIIDYYNVDQLEDITPYIEEEGKEWSSDFVSGLWGNFIMEDGKTYGLPFQHSVCVLYYNRDMLEKADAKVPTNWSELLETSQKLQEYNDEIVPVEFPSDVWILEALTLSDSGNLVNSATETNFDSKEVVESLEVLRSLVDGGAMIRSYAEAGEDFAAESCAMMLNTTGNLGFIAENATFDWDVTMVPVNTSPAFSYGGGGLIMTANQSEEEKAASWEFMKYMTSAENSAKWMSISGYFTVRNSAGELDITKEYYSKNPQLQHAAELLQYTQAQWTTESYWDVYNCMQVALDSVLIDRSSTAQEALATAQADSMMILGNN